MNETGPLATPPRDTGSREERTEDRLIPAPPPCWKDQPLSSVPVEQIGYRVLGLEDEARRRERALGESGVEPDGCRKRRPLRQHQRRQLVERRVALPGVGDLAVLLRPGGDRRDDADDQRSDRALAGAVRPAGEVAPGNDRDREIRPSSRSLDVLAGEGHAPSRVGDPHRACGPLELLESGKRHRPWARPWIRWRSNQSPASSATSSSAPGSSNRWVAPGTTAISAGAPSRLRA